MRKLRLRAADKLPRPHRESAGRNLDSVLSPLRFTKMTLKGQIIS